MICLKKMTSLNINCRPFGRNLFLFRRLNAKGAGFSLPEVIVSLFIIVMITAIFLANYKGAEKRSDLTLSAQNLVSDIHLAQSYALGLAEYAGDVPTGGWGLHFDTSASSSDHYLIFADINGNQRYDVGEEDANSGGRTTYLSRNIRLSSFTHVTSPLDITFLPPDPITTIYGASGTSTVADIVLIENGQNSQKTIQINFLGLAEVID